MHSTLLRIFEFKNSTLKKKIITVDRVALPQTETLFFRLEENVKKQTKKLLPITLFITS